MGGISSSSSGTVTVAKSDLTTCLHKSLSLAMVTLTFSPVSCMTPPDCISLLEKPQYSQWKLIRMISL